jgi:spore germination protein (amino acid permease)
LNGTNAVTSKQMALFTFVCQTGIGIITLPTALANEVGHDGWISVIITGFLAIIVAALIALLLKNNSGKGILDINKAVFGRVIGTGLNFLIFTYLLIAASAGATIFVIYLRISFFPLTPPLIMSLLILTPSFYMVWYGLKTVARFKTCTLFSYAIILVYIILIYRDIRLTFLMPVGEAGIIPLLYSIKITYFSFIGLELIAVFYAEITDKDKALKWHVYANIFSMLFLLIITAASTAVFGEKFLPVQSVALFNLFRVYNVNILERVDLFIIASWFFAMGCSIRAYMMASWYSLIKICKVQKNAFIYLLYIFLLLIISRIPKDINQSYYFLDIINYSGMGITIFFILSLFISAVKMKGGKKHEKG